MFCSAEWFWRPLLVWFTRSPVAERNAPILVES
jgi:hypothetical protein